MFTSKVKMNFSNKSSFSLNFDGKKFSPLTGA